MPAKRRKSPPRRARHSLEAERIEQRFRRLITAGVAIFSHHTLDGVLQEVADVAREVVGARYAALGVLAPDGEGLSNFVTSGLDKVQRERIGDLPSGRGLLGVVIHEARPIRTADLNRHPQRFGFPPHHPPMKSFLGVPITTGKTVFGNLYLTDKIGAASFDAEDESIAVLLATQAAVAVESARLHEASERLLNQVRGMQRQRDLFFAMMNHELRNALTGVFGWAERLVAGKTPESTARAVHEVYEGTEHTITLLNNFLDLTRLDAGKVKPVWREVDPQEAVTRAFSGFTPAAETKRVRLAGEVQPGTSRIVSDPVRLNQILVNLLSNAMRHSPAGGTIRVTVAPNGATVVFSVADQGPGVSPEHRDRLFEPFERFDPHSGLGTGLGLPVSRRLAEVLGGDLQLTSRPGEGAVFTLTLPIVQATV
jgi:signal transduction histidine kinase